MKHDNVNESLLEKLKAYSQKPNDCVEGVRNVAARLHSRACSQDKHVKAKTLERIWQKNQGGLTLILYMLETVRDPLTAVSLAGILHECVVAKTGKNRSPAVGQLVHLNATQSLIKQLVALQVKETVSINDVLIQEIVWTLSQLAQRDAKFSLKTRLLGAVKTFHYFLKAYHNHAKLLFPMLLISKALSRNSNTVAVLARDGIVATMEKVLSNIGFTPSAKLRIAMNVISYLSKNRVCCSRIIQSNLLGLILRIFERWERYDGKMKFKICHYSLVILQRVCYLKTGRKAVRGLSGVSILYRFSHNCPEEKIYDQLLTRVCGIINFCLERKTLPVDDTYGPTKFAVPAVSGTSINEKACKDMGYDFDEGDSDDEILEDFEEDSVNQIQGNDPEESKLPPQSAKERDLEDLKSYSSFCLEFVDSVTGSEPVNIPPAVIKPPALKPLSKTTTSVHKEVSKPIATDLYDKCTFLAIDKGRHLTTDIKFLPKEKLNSLDIRFISSDHSFVAKHRQRAIEKTGDSKSSTECTAIECKTAGMTNTQGRGYNKEDLISLKVLRNLHQEHGMLHAYAMIASEIRSVIPFVKIAYPDLVGGEGYGKLEPLNVKDRKVCRQKLLDSVDKGLHGSASLYNVVYDLDQLIVTSSKNNSKVNKELYNDDETKLGVKSCDSDVLQFESRFESGNLRKAIQVGPREYELILNADVNSDRHHNWFYFEVSNMDNILPYTFNIVNFEKMNSQFNYGMKPILYSVQEAVLGRPGWVRAGSDICYFRNSYQKLTGQQKCYFTTTFSITFQHNLDVCYIAYHFPYTYSQLLSQIWKWSCSTNYAVTYFRAEPLCETLNGNQLPVLTITAVDSKQNAFSDRETVFLTARVHPGESNASLIMLGTLQFLLSNHTQAISLRSRYVFKVIPMLNIEGVINGCARCGLTNEDLNRRWKNPHPILHPEIYHTKGLLEYCTRVLQKPPFVFCDFHGHSRKKNVFLYGCANSESWCDLDKQQSVSPVEYLLIAHLMKHFCPAFSFSSCKFRVERSRESTARVAVWRDFGIKRSYTMESSYCGCDQGIYAGHHLDTVHLKEVGKQFCEVLACLHDETTWRLELLLESQEAATKFCEITGNVFSNNTGSDSQSDLLENSDSISNSDDDIDVEDD